MEGKPCFTSHHAKENLNSPSVGSMPIKSTLLQNKTPIRRPFTDLYQTPIQAGDKDVQKSNLLSRAELSDVKENRKKGRASLPPKVFQETSQLNVDDAGDLIVDSETLKQTNKDMLPEEDKCLPPRRLTSDITKIGSSPDLENDILDFMSSSVQPITCNAPAIISLSTLSFGHEEECAPEISGCAEDKLAELPNSDEVDEEYENLLDRLLNASREQDKEKLDKVNLLDNDIMNLVSNIKSSNSLLNDSQPSPGCSFSIDTNEKDLPKICSSRALSASGGQNVGLEESIDLSDDCNSCSSDILHTTKELVRQVVEEALFEMIEEDVDEMTKEESRRDRLPFEDGVQNLFLNFTPSRVLRSVPFLIPVNQTLNKKDDHQFGGVENDDCWPSQISSQIETAFNMPMIDLEAASVSPVEDDLGPLSVQDVGSSCIKTPEGVNTWGRLKGPSLLDSSSPTSPVGKVSEASGTPVKTVSEGYGMNVKMETEACETLVKMVSQICGTSPDIMDRKSVATDRPHTCDIMVGGNAVMSCDASSMITPKKYLEFGNHMTPILMTSSCCGSSPLTLASKGIETDKPGTADVSVGGIPYDMTDSSTMVTPTKTKEAETEMVITDIFSVAVGTSPVQVESIACETEGPAIRDAGVGESIVSVTDACNGHTPLKFHDVECGTTPAKLIDVSQMMSPLLCKDAEIGTSPLLCRDVEIGTSPLFVSSIRFSHSTPSSIDKVALMEHVKTSSISNQLLRRELEQMKEKQLVWAEKIKERELDIDSRLVSVRVKEGGLEEVQRTAKLSVRKDIEDLLQQIGQQISQIGVLQEELEEQKGLVANLEDEKQKLKTQYKAEVKDLQEDLCRAFTQNEEEISKLQSEIEKGEVYKDYYQRSSKQIQSLERQLKSFSDLKDVVQEATNVQSQLHIVDDTFSQVQRLFDKTMGLRAELQKEREELNEKEKKIEKLQEATLAKEKQWAADKLELEEKMKEINAHTNRAEEDKLQLQKRVSSLTLEKNRLHDQVQTSKQEIEKFQTEIEEREEELMSLNKSLTASYLEEQTLKATMTAEIKKREEEIKKLEGVATDLRGNIRQITAKKERIESEFAALQTRLDAAMEAKSTLEVQIKATEDMFKETKSFLEEEHSVLEETHKETEAELHSTLQTLSECQIKLQMEIKRSQNDDAVIKNLRHQLEVSQAELKDTQHQARQMLLEQGSEIANTSIALYELQARINTSLSGNSTSPPCGNIRSENSTEKQMSTSLVYAVLHSFDGSSPDTLNSTSISQAPLRPSPLNLTNESVQSKISPVSVNSISPSNLNSSNGSSTSIGVAVDNSSSMANQDALESRFIDRTWSDLDLPNQAGRVSKACDTLLEEMSTTIARLKQKVEEVEAERDLNQSNLRKLQKQCDKEIQFLRGQLSEMDTQMKRTKQEMTSEVKRSHDLQELLAKAEIKVKTTSEALNQWSEQRRAVGAMQEQIQSLLGQLKMAEMEKKNLETRCYQLQSLRYSDGRNRDSVSSISALSQENLTLMKKVEKLETKMKSRDCQYRSAGERAASQMKILEGNWRKAEEEVTRLDQLFQHCQKLVAQLPSTYMSENATLKDLMELFGR